MNRIEKTFAQLRRRREPALVPFIVAGDPTLEQTESLVLELEARGADLVELGVPFSDPAADGPANQRALERGLRAGASVDKILALVARLRSRSQIALVLFGYFNPVLRYGCARFCADAGRAGVDGLLIVDLPPEEAGELRRPARACGLDLIHLLAPTTPAARAARIVRMARGFLYYVSVAGVTGVRDKLPSELEPRVAALRRLTDLPIGVGFGISTPAQAAAVASFADAAVVGSAFSLLIERHGASAEALEAVGALAGQMKAAMRQARAGGPRQAQPPDDL
ncbi:MAG: tryptophan synthase subunit alpha [Deltaproteobacteria bacterium]|nr:tryptophan synthase subunit alpha [Deltaproteobacteria bacterium]